MKTTPLWALWGGPMLMGVLTTTGLVSALVSDTWGDWWSWVGLGVPVVVMGWRAWPRSPSATTAHAARSQPQPDADKAGANATPF